MSDEGFSDPGELPEGGDANRMNAKNLKNQVLLLKPTLHDTVPGTKPNANGEVKPWEFVECDVWVLDRTGVVETGQGVRFSWWRAVRRLQSQIGEFVACKPMEQDDNSVDLVPLEGDARKVAAQVVADIRSTEPM